MKKCLTLIFVLFCSFSQAQIIELKNSYQSLPDTIKTSKDFETVWNILVTKMSEKPFSLQMQDKNNGLILSDNFRIKWTYETRDAKLKDEDAFIIVHREYNHVNNTIKPEIGYHGYVTGEVSLKVIPQINGSIVIVSLVNTQKAYYNLTSGVTENKPFNTYASTGNLDKLIASYIQ